MQQDGNIRALGKVSVTNTDFWRNEATAWAEAWSSTALGSCNVQSSPVIVESSAYSAGSYLIVFACGSRVVAMDGSKATATSIWDVDCEPRLSYFITHASSHTSSHTLYKSKKVNGEGE